MKNKLANAHRLTAVTITAVAVLALCGLATPTIASPGNPITRPLKVIEGHLTITIDPATGAAHFTDWGWATHTGLFSNSGSAVVDLATRLFVGGNGTVIDANGDTLDWTIAGPNTVVYTGGTGQFEGVTGGFLGRITSTTLLSANPDGTLTFAMTYDGKGTITY